jgi:phosphoserine phosphatase
MMDLIIQGLDVATPDLKKIAKLVNAKEIHNVNNGRAFRLTDATRNPEVVAYCSTARLDFAYAPKEQRLSDYGLVVMDMDSTLITIECIDEIADMLGIKPEVAAITASAMRGEIDFAESLTRRVALLKGLEESALQQVYDMRLRLSPGAELMLNKMKAKGIKSLLVSGGFTFFTDRLKSRLNLDFAASNTLEIIDGKLTGKILSSILDAQAKADWLIKISAELDLKTQQVIAIGDGANDLKMLSKAGISIAYHAKPVVQQQSTYALNYTGLDGVLNLFND